MKLIELRAECERVRGIRKQCGLDPDTAMVILIVPGRMRGARKRVAPGLVGRAIGENDDGTVMVDCEVTDVERWLARIEQPATTRDAAQAEEVPRAYVILEVKAGRANPVKGRN